MIAKNKNNFKRKRIQKRATKGAIPNYTQQYLLKELKFASSHKRYYPVKTHFTQVKRNFCLLDIYIYIPKPARNVARMGHQLNKSGRQMTPKSRDLSQPNGDKQHIMYISYIYLYHDILYQYPSTFGVELNTLLTLYEWERLKRFFLQ